MAYWQGKQVGTMRECKDYVIAIAMMPVLRKLYKDEEDLKKQQNCIYNSSILNLMWLI